MVLGGLAMLRVLQGAFVASFGGGRFTLGALVSLLVTVADIGMFNIGAAFWGLVAGFGVSWLMEKHDTNAPKLLGNLIYVHYGNFQSLVMVATITKGNFPIYLKS